MSNIRMAVTPAVSVPLLPETGKKPRQTGLSEPDLTI